MKKALLAINELNAGTTREAMGMFSESSERLVDMLITARRIWRHTDGHLLLVFHGFGAVLMTETGKTYVGPAYKGKRVDYCLFLEDIDIAKSLQTGKYVQVKPPVMRHIECMANSTDF